MLDVSNGDYKGTVAKKLHSDGTKKKRTQEFIAEVQVMMINDPNNLARSIAKNMKVSFFVSHVK